MPLHANEQRSGEKETVERDRYQYTRRKEELSYIDSKL